MFGQNSIKNLPQTGSRSLEWGARGKDSEIGEIFIAPESGADLELTSAETEGQLSVDVLETETELVVVATMAGTRPEDIILHLHNDFLTIRGRRSPPVAGPARYFFEECYWGKFSRTIVLPVDVRGEMVKSEYKNGILTVRLPKISTQKTIPILVVED